MKLLLRNEIEELSTIINVKTFVKDFMTFLGIILLMLPKRGDWARLINIHSPQPICYCMNLY